MQKSIDVHIPKSLSINKRKMPSSSRDFLTYLRRLFRADYKSNLEIDNRRLTTDIFMICFRLLLGSVTQVISGRMNHKVKVRKSLVSIMTLRN